MIVVKALNHDIICQAIKLGNDLQVCVYGGNHSHIGSVVVACPYQKDGKTHVTCSSITLLEHKDDIVASMFAKKLAIEFNAVVCTSCGIHYDNVTKDELEQIIVSCQDLLKKLIKQIKEEQNG